MTPTISVILPVFNGRRFLAQAVASVARQTLPPDELILVDDGSSDGSLRLVESLDLPFPVRVVCQGNAGQSAARNHGASIARGDLFAFLDQDDIWHQEHLQALTAALAAEDETAWVYSDFDEIDVGGHVVTHCFLREHGSKHPKASVADCVAADLMVLPSASVLRREAFFAVGGFDEALCGYEDDDLFLRVFRAGWGHVFLPRALLRFRIHGGGSSANLHFLQSRLHFAAKLQEMLPDDPRMRRYYLRDCIAPRFFQTTLDDYVRACAARDWEAAREELRMLNHFARLREAGLQLRWKMLWIQQPHLFRTLVSVNSHLPRPLRFLDNPVLTSP